MSRHPAPGTGALRAGPLAVLCSLITVFLPGATSAQTHPLDPPTWEEHWTALEVLKDAGRMDDSTGFSLVLLEAPAKDAVWGWRPGADVPRSLLLVTRRGAMTSEAVVDVKNRRLVSWTDRPGAQAPWLDSEFSALTAAVKKHPDFMAALAARGITDLQWIECFAGPPGRFGLEEEEGRRLAHVHCTDSRLRRNDWTRGIEGLVVVGDMISGEILRVEDEGVVPVPETNADFGAHGLGAPRPDPKPILVTQPQGLGYTLTGHQVAWENWRFHVRPDQRVGMVISTVRWADGQDVRPVLYEGHLSEIFVPYMDPAGGWFARNFLDSGEYTSGGLGKPLARGIDCPDYATYLDMVVVTDSGRPRDVQNVICIFERTTGDVAWRHLRADYQGRPKRDLVVRAAAVLGNYDYIFDWVFQQNGSIDVGIGATGIAESKPVVDRVASPGAGNGSSDEGWEGGRDDSYGRFVDEHIVAVNHDHYFNFRLDMDVDGPVNTVRREGLRAVELPEDHARRSVWVVDGAPLRTEDEAKLNVVLTKPAIWRVVSPNRSNKQAYPTSYQLKPGSMIENLFLDGDWPRLRAGFIDHHLWVTPRRPDEIYAAGMYPTLSGPGEGLPSWTAGNRNIENEDVVLWYTMGMHHVVRTEDWPVMPVAYGWFELRPFDFFDRNPVLNLPKKP
jgi:primary-amine oxidase